MRPATLLRLAVAGGRGDTMRIGLTAVSSALATVTLLAAAIVDAIPEPPDPGDFVSPVNNRYTTLLLDEPGLRPGVIVALLMLAIPVVVLAGQCVRFGSPARDRRLAALRLAGATPGQSVAVAVAETATGALLGSLWGLATVLVGQALLGRPDADGRLALPTDVLPTMPIVAAIVVGVPLLAGLLGIVLMRGIIVTPLGVVRRTRTRPPRLWPGVLLVVGGFAPFVIPVFNQQVTRLETIPAVVALIVAWGLVLMAVLGVIVGTGWIAHTAGRILQRVGRRPAMLLAGRQLMAAPWSGSRTFATLLAGVIVASAAAALQQAFTTQHEAVTAARASVDGVIWSPLVDDDFAVQTMKLITVAVAVAVLVSVAGVMVALAEGIVTRRRAYAALIAGGVPRRTLGEALVWQTMVPLIPAMLIATGIGYQLTGTFKSLDHAVTAGDTHIGCYTADPLCTPAAASDSPIWTNVDTPVVTMVIPVPLGDLAVLWGGTLVAMIAVVAVGIVLLRRSTDLEELRVA
jgi:hypothetical protein